MSCRSADRLHDQPTAAGRTATHRPAEAHLRREFLDAGTVTTTERADGIHFSVENYRAVGHHRSGEGPHRPRLTFQTLMRSNRTSAN